MSEEDIPAQEIAGEALPRKESTKAMIIPVDESGQLAPQSHIQLMAIIDRMIVAKAIPKHLENREQVMCAWNFAAQLGLPPQPSLRNVAVIEGTPSLFGDLPLALVQRHPDFIYYSEHCIDAAYNKICVESKNLDAEVWGGVIYIQRKGMSKPESYAFTKPDADRAGLLRRAKNGMPWISYPQVMYTRRARIIGIRAHFADAITGALIAEEMGYAPDLKDVTPVDRVAQLNDRFSSRGESYESNTVRSSRTGNT